MVKNITTENPRQEGADFFFFAILNERVLSE